MADIINSIASVARYLVAPIGRQLGYLFNYHSNIGDLKTQYENLENARGRVEHSVDDARKNAYKIKLHVEQWLDSANEISKKAREISRDDEDKAKKRCFKGLCPNLKLRYQLSKKAKKTTKEVVVKIQDGEKLGCVFDRLPPPGIGSTSTKDYEAFKSRKLNLEEIMEALRNPNINMIGVCGMGGVGKTTLVKEVARIVMKDKLFDAVVMTVVSQAPNIRKIQEDIAAPLEFRFEAQETDFGRAYRLCERLKQEKSILIILDDVWDQLDLEAVGIPCRDIHKGCKIVVTSRSEDVLSNEMKTQKNFRIGVLLEEEAWNLFKKIVEDSLEAMKPTALEIVKECAGLPIAVVVVASALRNRRLPAVWEDALQQLRSSAPTNIKGMDAKVYLSLKLSYDALDSEEAKSLFLLCSLFPEDYEFSVLDLLKYGKGLGLIQGMYELEMARNRVHALVCHLKASCLLMDGKTFELSKMHDVVRDVGIYIASKDNDMLIMRNSGELDEWTVEEKLKLCHAISLPYSDIQELPTCLESPELRFLLFFSNNDSLKIPDTFFKGMNQLKVLSLRNVSFSSLPSSLSFVSSLQTLCLDKCKLQDISLIGDLKKLEILSFRGSNIRELPGEIGKLTRLKLLDLTGCGSLEVIPSNVIASLSQLEELYMEDSFDKWEVDGNARLAELKGLSHLVTLVICIPDGNILPNDLVFEKLIRYTILVGKHSRWYSIEHGMSRTLHLEVKTSIHLLFGIKTMLKSTEDLKLNGLNGFKSIVYELDEEGFHDLKHLCVQNSDEMEYVINTMIGIMVSYRAFRNLEDLRLVKLINLKEICHGQLPANSFSNLRKVDVFSCNRLQNLFSLSVARRLSKLQEIRIWSCKNVDEIVAEEKEAAEHNNEAMHEIVFPQLCYSSLVNLPELTCFSKVKVVPSLNYASKTDAGSKEIILEGEYSISVPLFNEKVAFVNLEGLNLKNLPKLMAVWKKVDSQGIFQGMVEEIDEVERVEEEVMDKIVFSQLTSMSLQSLPLLRSVCQGIHISEWPSLKELTVWSCENVEILVLELSSWSERHGKDYIGTPTKQPLFLVHKVAFPNLEQLTLYNLPKLTVAWKKDSQRIFQDMMEEIIEKGVEEEAMDKIVFSQLTNLFPSDLPLLKSFCQGIHISEWPSLVTLNVISCENVDILVLELSSLNERHGKGHLDTPTKQPLFLVYKVAFPNLKQLTLHNLPKLTVAWKKDSQRIFQDMMEEIIEKGVEEEAIDKIVFSQLIYLSLIDLPLLKSFCQGIHISEWPSLKILNVDRCENVEVLVLELSSLNERHGKDYLCTPAKQPLFLVYKVAFPNLEKLMLYNLPKLTAVWQKDSQGIFQDMVEEIVGKEKIEEEAMDKIVFSQLTSLSLKGLPLLKSFCQGIHISEWSFLEKLEVISCKNVEILISELSRLNERLVNCHLDVPTKQPFFLVHKVAFPNLEKLILDDLPKLTAVWQKDSQGIFQGMVEEIVGKERIEEEAMDKIVFSQLTSLSLTGLPLLKSFCQGIHISEWPSLEELTVTNCENVEILVLELSSLNERLGNGHLGAPTKQPFFLVHKVAFPELEKMEFKQMSSMVEIWQGQFHAPSFCKLRVLKVKECNKILKVFPISLLQNLQNLEEVYVESCSSLEEVFEIEGLVGEIGHASTFPPLRILSLNQLPKLMHLWKEDSQLSAVFQNLRTLRVRSCGSLTHLYASSIAEGLVQIESITAADEKGEATYGTIFSQLYFLELKDLPNLTSFCPGSNNFSFPSLEFVFVEECPELKTFSNNILYTPKLEKVLVKWSESIWYGGLNTTIQQLFKQKVSIDATNISFFSYSSGSVN